MRRVKKIPCLFEHRVVKRFLLLPKTLPITGGSDNLQETRWFELCFIEQIHYRTSDSYGSWIDSAWAD